MAGTALGLLDWAAPGKFGGKCARVEVGGTIADVCASDVELGIFAVATTSGVNNLGRAELTTRVK